MHELTLLFGVAEQVTDAAKENGLDHVDAVVLQIGEVTGVVPEFMQDGYPIVMDNYDVLRGSELIIEVIPGIAKCQSCGTEYELNPNKGICPHCGSQDKDLLSGREFIIKEIQVKE